MEAMSGFEPEDGFADLALPLGYVALSVFVGAGDGI